VLSEIRRVLLFIEDRELDTQYCVWGKAEYYSFSNFSVDVARKVSTGAFFHLSEQSRNGQRYGDLTVCSRFYVGITTTQLFLFSKEPPLLN